MDFSDWPLIGITAPVPTLRKTVHGTAPHIRLKASYTETLASFGAVALIIPDTLDGDALRACYQRVDGLLLPGGGDVHPRYYSATPLVGGGQVDARLDMVEIELARWALADGKPILGICRGHQVLNVAAGGTLYQDLTTERSGEILHKQEGAERYHPSHGLEIDARSRLEAILGVTGLQVNSTHHQAVCEVAPGWRATAWAPDGVVEGIEPEDGGGFALGVQCHPEELWAELETRFGRLFRAFVEAARGGGGWGRVCERFP